jgi:heat-inducible transcriptional repressor
MAEELNKRERTVLHYVVHDFIETAVPIGSRYISKRHEDVLGLSSASIRNVMSDLEYLGYINHPHTSAGRIPTDLGYRFYLDSLMKLEALSASDEQTILQVLNSAEERDQLLKEASRLIGRISHLLCVITPPHLSSGTFEKLELVPIVSTKLLVIISVKSGLVRTIMMEISSEIPREKLEELARFLNERLSGLTIQEIRETFAERLKDVADDSTGLIRLFIESVEKLFPTSPNEPLHISGAEKVIEQPEFANPEDFRSVIELINNEEMIIHVLKKHEASSQGVTVKIGEENRESKLVSYSVITTRYASGEVTGTVGLIGPKRMNYPKVIPLVDYVARMISEMFSQQSNVS